MPSYNFKSITVVPSAKEFIDIVLSKTQRKTPTEIHKQYAIARIRNFYMRKVKTCQQFFHDKLAMIVTEFPVLETIHPFYADLINVLYSKDHFKLALGQLNTAKNIIDMIARDQLKVLKYGESLYQCKTLKRTAFGRMCTVIKRQADNLKFLEDTRQHLSRLPTIDPNTRTLVLCGFPNVGKSSFINKITRADVDVQPFPFTTKSIFVGHTDYKNLRWQVIDTPGVLDRPLDEHNTIEMVAITALAHLQAAIVFIMDLSCQCGYTIEQQVKLYRVLSPLFRNKPIVVALNKMDVCSVKDLSPEDQALLRSVVELPGETNSSNTMDISDDSGIDIIRPIASVAMSTLTEDGVMAVRTTACDALLSQRIEAKLQAVSKSNITTDGEEVTTSFANRLYVAKPRNQDGVELTFSHRPPIIPAVIVTSRKRNRPFGAKARYILDDEDSDGGLAKDEDSDEEMEICAKRKRVTMRQRELDSEPGQFIINLQEHWRLANADHANDVVPEILDGHNLADFMFDPDIEERLNKLEKQDTAWENKGVYDDADWNLIENKRTPEEREKLSKIRTTAKKIREARALRILEYREKKATKKAIIPRTVKMHKVGPMQKTLGDHGLPVDMQEEAARGRALSKARSERAASRKNPHREATAERVARPRSRSGVRDEKMHQHALKLNRFALRKPYAACKRGEADRHIPDLKPKHLFSGKRSTGKTDRR